MHHQKQKREVGSMRHEEKIKIKRRRRRKLFWLFAAAAVSALLLEEQAAVLYVLLALATCGVMTVLAFSNLHAGGAETQTPAFREAAHAHVTSSPGNFSRGEIRAAA
jgi:hypothetical protein